MAILSYEDGRLRYPLLRFFDKVFLVVGILSIISGCVLLLWGLGAPKGVDSKSDLISGAVSLVAGLVCMTYADVMRLMVHTEENTRVTAQLLARIAERLALPAPPLARIAEGGGFTGSREGGREIMRLAPPAPPA
jgi:hypothetical protein